MKLHDVIRDYLRAGLGPARLAELNRQLLDAVAARLPQAEGLDGKRPTSSITAWWSLGSDDRYLRAHLIEHLLGAGRDSEAGEVAADLRWIAARLQSSGVAAPVADLALVGTPQATGQAAALAREGHLLAHPDPAEPADAMINTLYSRLAGDPYWAAQVTALQSRNRLPGLSQRWALLDSPDPALRRSLPGHSARVTAMAVSRDGTWLVSGGSDDTVRIWDVATGRERAVLTEKGGDVLALVIAADRSWVTSYRSGGWVLIWDPATGRQRAAFTGMQKRVLTDDVAMAPDGRWLATSESKGGVSAVKIWAATGRPELVLTDRTYSPIVIAPDGAWLAGGCQDGTVRIWDRKTGRERVTLTGASTSGVEAIAISADGTWLAAGRRDGTIWTWDTKSGRERSAAVPSVPDAGQVKAVAIAPDSTWLAASYETGVTRVWDAASRRDTAVLVGPAVGGGDAIVISPDGTWLATGDGEGTIRIWEPARGKIAPPPNRTRRVTDMAGAPDGTWLATAEGTTLRIWDATSGRERASIAGHRGSVRIAAIGPDSTWIATREKGNAIRVWDTATGKPRPPLADPRSEIVLQVIAPDGSWVATSDAHGSGQIRNVTTGRDVAFRVGNNGPLRLVPTTPGTSWLALSGMGWGASVWIWDIATGREQAAFRCPRWEEAMSVAPDASWIATLNRWAPRKLRVYDTATGRKRFTVKYPDDDVREWAAAPDSSWLAVIIDTGITSSGPGAVRVYDTATGKVLAERRILRNSRSGRLIVTADGKWLAAAGGDGEILIWDTDTWKITALIRVEGEVRECAWLADKAIAAAGSDGLYLFDFALPAH